jgi:hypothetical protein
LEAPEVDEENVMLMAEACAAADKLFEKISNDMGMRYAVRAFAIVLGAQSAYQDNPHGALNDVERLLKQAMEAHYRDRAAQEKNQAAIATARARQNLVIVRDPERQGAVSRLDGCPKRDEPE